MYKSIKLPIVINIYMSSTKNNIFMITKLKKTNKWTKEEDNLLTQLAKKYSNKNWKRISSYFTSKNAFQCFSRYKRIRPGLKRGHWEANEDQKLLQLVHKHGSNWSKISKLMSNRNNKQVRDRYLNVLKPDLNRDAFTIEEDQMLLYYEENLGRKWTKIARYFKGRTSDRVKNRFYTLKKRTKKNVLFFSNVGFTKNVNVKDEEEKFQSLDVSKSWMQFGSSMNLSTNVPNNFNEFRNGIEEEKTMQNLLFGGSEDYGLMDNMGDVPVFINVDEFISFD